MKKIILTVVLGLFGSAYAQAQPSKQPEPGKCYVQCITPDEFRDVTETVQIAPSYKRLKVVPATYKTIEESVLVKEESKQLTYVPAVYETISVPYVKKAGVEVLSVVDATFGSDSKTFETYPKIGKWEYQVLENCISENKEDCIAACFVEYPEQTQTVAITTLAKDAGTTSSKTQETNAYYKKQVVKTPARVVEEIIPAVYSTIKKQVVNTPARVVDEIVTAKTTTVTKTELVKKGGMTVWEEVDCGLVSGANILPILYEYNSARITPASSRIIDENLLKLMRDKPALRIEIMSHTDSRGNDDYNKSLSQQRAQSVVNYLVKKGINRNRLIAKGFGETRLKNKCANGVQCSEKDHQANRRTEFRIIQGK